MRWLLIISVITWIIPFHPGEVFKWSLWSSFSSYCPASDLPFQNIPSPEKKKQHPFPPTPTPKKPKPNHPTMFPGIYVGGNELFNYMYEEKGKKKGGKKGKRGQITEDTFPVVAGLMLFNKWFIWLSKLRNALWIRGFSHTFKGKTGKISCSTETLFLKHIGKENLVFLFRDDVCLQLYPSASAGGAAPAEGMCLQRKLVLTCSSETNSNQAVGMVSGKFRATFSFIPHCTLALLLRSVLAGMPGNLYPYQTALPIYLSSSLTFCQFPRGTIKPIK